MGRLFPFQSLLYVSPYTYGALIFIFQRHPRYVNPYRALIQPLTMGRFYPFSSAMVCQSLYLWGYYFLFHLHGAPIPYTYGPLISILEFQCITFAELILISYRLCTPASIPTGRLFSFPIVAVCRSHMGNLHPIVAVCRSHMGHFLNP